MSTSGSESICAALIVIRRSDRASDAIALAIRAGTTIFAAESVLAEAGVAIPDEADGDVEVDVEMERFREFLDQVSPEDFETGS